MAVAWAAATDAGPREKSKDRAGSADAIAVVEVVGGRIVEVHGAFDQAQAEDARVEIDVATGITGDGGDMVEAGEMEVGGGGRGVHGSRCFDVETMHAGTGIASGGKGHESFTVKIWVWVGFSPGPQVGNAADGGCRKKIQTSG